MNKLLWFARMIFAPKSRLSEQDKLDWNWWIHVELSYWWFTTPVYRAFQHCMQWTLANVRRNKDVSEDEIPF